MPVNSLKMSNLQAWRTQDPARVPQNILNDIDKLDGRLDRSLSRWDAGGGKLAPRDVVSLPLLEKRAKQKSEMAAHLRKTADQAECSMSLSPQQVADRRATAASFSAEASQARRIASWMKTIGCTP